MLEICSNDVSIINKPSIKLTELEQGCSSLVLTVKS